jgi:hypothetical protein
MPHRKYVLKVPEWAHTGYLSGSRVYPISTYVAFKRATVIIIMDSINAGASNVRRV